MKSYSIQFVSKVTGLSPHTIRAWEKRYQTVTPQRDELGRRLYNEEELDRLMMLQNLVGLGNKISELTVLDREELKKFHEKYFSEDLPMVGPETSKIDLNRLLQNLLMATRGFKLDIIGHELEKARNQLDTRQFGLNVLSPLLQEIGSLYSNRQISIGKEHALSALLRFYVGSLLYDYTRKIRDSRYNVILATPESDLHEFGIMIAALLFKHYGIKFYYLGPNLPAESLVESALQIESSIVVLGVSKGIENRPNNFLSNYIEQLSPRLERSCEIWLGGDIGREASELEKYRNLQIVPSLQLLDHKIEKLSN